MPDTTQQPPQPPEFTGKARFYTYQIVGMAVIVLIPILALATVFGTTQARATVSAGELEVEVTYPSKIRYKTIHPLEVTVTNSGTSEQDVTLYFDTGYLNKFSNVTVFPEPEYVNEQEYAIELDEVAPGEARIISLEVQAERYGSFSGTVRVEGDQNAELTLHTISFP